MKLLFAILMSLQIISGNTFLSEMTKVPALLHHFIEHRHEEKEISFMQFLHEHYCCENQVNYDGQHEQLPLKHCTDCCQHNNSVFQYFHSSDKINFLVQGSSASCYVAKVFFAGTEVSDAVWQPPRLS